MARILIIDDEKITIERLKSLLELDEHEVFTAGDGQEGLEVFKREQPDIALVDIKMPGMNGIEVLREIKKKNGVTEVIIITGHGGVETAIGAVKEGAFGYIRKPVDYDELEIEIKRALKKQGMQKKLDEYMHNMEEALEGKEGELKQRIRAETKITRQNALLEGINQVFKRALTCETLWELGETCLDICEKMTGSKSGFIGELNSKGLFDTIAISNPGWNACEMPGTGKTKSIKDMKIRGIWSSAIREGKSRIVNDPTSHPDRTGTPKGHPPIISFLGVPLKDAGKIIGMIGLGNKESGYDTSDQENVEKLAVAIMQALRRKRAEEEAKEAKEFLTNAIENSIDAIIITDNKGCIARANQSFLRMISGEEQEIIGKHMVEFRPIEGTYESTTGESVQIDKEYLEKHDSYFISTLSKEGRVRNYERYFLRSDGKLAPVELNISFIHNEKGEHVGEIGVVRDISEKKKMQDKLLQSEKLKSLGELAGGVAHDLNNCLAAILGRAQLLKMIFEPPQGKEERSSSMVELKESLDVIEQASRDGAETIRRIQEFARRRDDDKHFTTVDLNEIVDSALAYTRMRWKDDAESKGIQISIEKEFSTLPVTSGSAAELREVVTNLISNAVDAMPQGGEIKIKTYREDSHIAIKIEDTGVGIPDHIKNKIFDPFFTTKGVQSTGLGMSVSYGIIRRHRGTINVDSVEGQGTTFTIKLPVRVKTAEKGKVKPISGKIKKALILVIEDEEKVGSLLSAILKKGGHEVETAISGDQGIEIYEKNEFDLVFTDLGMPGMSGWQVAEKVKSINGRVPVVLITGWDIRQEEAAENKDSYVDLIINKPFEMDQVLNIVQEGLILRDRFKTT